MTGDTRPPGGRASDGPLLRMVRGEPSPEELAAVVAVLLARSAPTPAARAVAPRSTWADRPRLLRPPLSPGPGAWRAAAFPR